FLVHFVNMLAARPMRANIVPMTRPKFVIKIWNVAAALAKRWLARLRVVGVVTVSKKLLLRPAIRALVTLPAATT
ncbi:hypothetical protein, partial [Bacillus cereus group sp. BC327]|uniref:hypothetical protein n=1 Tax=Bacillus cereus group sp. BC327 TaxID=3445309 RepID=UPI003F1F1C24